MVHPQQAEVLKKFDLLSLANNHIGDGGIKGLEHTHDWLREKGIDTVGAGKTAAAACEIKTISVNDYQLGFIAFNTIETDDFTATTNEPGSLSYPEHKAEIEAAIAHAKVDYLIAIPHWGDEYTALVNDEQREIARWLIHSGVDLIVGSHSHCLQSIDFYQGKCIIYSLGNFIFEPQMKKGFNTKNLASLQLGDYGIEDMSILSTTDNRE